MRRQAAIDEGCPNNMREDNARAGTRPKVTGIDVPKAFTRQNRVGHCNRGITTVNNAAMHKRSTSFRTSELADAFTDNCHYQVDKLS
jgi:hypothetical protein